jgi:hypothetical protein
MRSRKVVAAALGLMIMASAFGSQDKSENKPPKEKLTAAGTLAGKISKLSKDKASFSLKVSAAVPYPKGSTSGKKSSPGLRQKKVSETPEIRLADDAIIKLMENGKRTDSTREDLRKGQMVEVTVVKNRLGERFATNIVIYP